MLKSTRFCTVLLLFIAQVSSAQYDEFNDLPIDSALVWLNNNIVENPDNFHDRALRTLKRAYALKDQQLKGEAHLLLADWHGYYVPFTMDSVILHAEKALALLEATNDREKMAKICSNLVVDYQSQNDLKRAEEFAFRALEIYEELGDRKGVGKIYRRLAGLYLDQKEPDLAFKYIFQALEIGEELEDHYNVAIAWLNLIKIYTETDQLEKAVEAGNNCISTVNKEVPDEIYLLARAYAYRGRALTELESYDKSIEDHSKAFSIVAEALGPENSNSKSFREGIGYAYHMQGNYKEALPHYNAAVDAYIDLRMDHSPAMQRLYENVADCYFQLGNYKESILNQRIAYSVFDTLMQDKVANLESEALIKYETGKKDQALAEQATTIKQNDRIQLLGIGFIALLLLFLGTLFYYFRRNKKIANALLVKNQENELLLKEIHHRVKNNLQTISSLLSLQSESISDKSALDAVQESRNRVASMALIHQKLYQGENLAAIEMRDYFETISKAIKDSFGDKAENVSLEVNMSEIELDVDTAIPIGLITNELITNSLKHAFQNKEDGKILITLSHEKNGLLKLHIADNGEALGKESDVKKEKGFGSLLIQLLTTQLGGTLEKSNTSGTSTMIQFPIQEKSAA